jgi:hypothetical protein
MGKWLKIYSKWSYNIIYKLFLKIRYILNLLAETFFRLLLTIQDVYKISQKKLWWLTYEDDTKTTTISYYFPVFIFYLSLSHIFIFFSFSKLILSLIVILLS